MTSTSKKYKVIGTRPIRHDGVDKVTGTANYGSDINLKGMLYGKVLRSPHPHARIKKIDTSNVFKLEGVKAVVTNDDDIAEKVKLLRDHGRDDNGEFQTWGFNSRLDNLQAAILC